MDILRAFRNIRQITGSRGPFSMGRQDSAWVSVPMPSQGLTTHLIGAPRISRSILRDHERFTQFRFLDRILVECDSSQVNWIRYFVDHHPEFYDGPMHAELREAMAPQIGLCADAIEGIPESSIRSCINHHCKSQPSPTSLQLGKRIIRLYFQVMLSSVAGKEIAVDDQTLCGIDVFRPIQKISTLEAWNGKLAQLVEAAGFSVGSTEPSRLMTFLTLVMMGSTPTLAAVVTAINQIIDLPEGSTTFDARTRKQLLGFEMVPTNFVARRCVESCQIESHACEAGDILYVFLGDASGCPFRPGSTLPFGYGQHVCSGMALTKVLMAGVMDALEQERDTIAASSVLTSPVTQGYAMAFLDHVDL